MDERALLNEAVDIMRLQDDYGWDTELRGLVEKLIRLGYCGTINTKKCSICNQYDSGGVFPCRVSTGHNWTSDDCSTGDK